MTSHHRRVWITGIGPITAIGTANDPFRAGLRAGVSPVKRIDRFDPSPFRSQVAAQVDDFDPLAWMPPKMARQLDRFSQFGLVAGRLALDDAGLRPGEGGAAAAERIGIYLGSALGGIVFAEEQHEKYLERGIKAVAPNLALAVFGGAAPANLGIALDVRGPILSTANSCASGAVAIGEALDAIRAGDIDAAIAGGVEVPLSPLAFGAFDIIRALSDRHNDDPGHACRPFDADRDGFVMGEGATLLVLEAEDVAGRAARSHTPRSSATPRPRTRSTWSSRGPTGARRGGRPPRRWWTRAWRPPRSTGSAPTRPRRRSATSPRPGRSRWPSASGRPPCP